MRVCGIWSQTPICLPIFQFSEVETSLQTATAKNIPIPLIGGIIVKLELYLPGKDKTSPFLILLQLPVAEAKFYEHEGHFGDSFFQPPLLR